MDEIKLYENKQIRFVWDEKKRRTVFFASRCSIDTDRK